MQPRSTAQKEEKLQQLLEQQRDRTSKRLKTFNYTDQLASTETRRINTPPDNHVEEGNIGSYFGSTQGAVTANVVAPSPPKKQHQPGMASTRRKTPAERQQEMDAYVQERVRYAMQEQEDDQRRRLDSCKVQRDVERLKLHQRTRSRIELQHASGQALKDGVADQLELQDTQNLGSTVARQRKAALFDEPQRQFVAHNRIRMENNLRHREYCRETMKERSAARRELEDHIQTYSSKQKSQLLQTIGFAGASSTVPTIPTTEELHESETYQARARDTNAEEAAQLSVGQSEVSALDDHLWNMRRSTKGKKAERIRELPFELTAPHHRDGSRDESAPASIKLPNLGAWKTASGSAKQ